ncbi:MAG: phage holin family protein [Zoogloeaceae bacterium]|jgi:uncharacterized membrane protein YqjE|nr:phage holin family protein [Zoogloeaceae bacterium]
MRDKPGFFQTLKRLLRDLLEIGQTRLALLANEAEEEKIRLVRIFAFCILALFCLGVGVMLLVAFLTLLFWESRLLLLGATCLGFLALAVILLGLCRASLRHGPLFAATLAELQRDIASLRDEPIAASETGTPHESPTA